MKDCIDGLSLYKRFFRFVPLIVRHKVFVIGREKKTWCTFEIQIETTRIQNQIFHIYVQCKYGISPIQNNFPESENQYGVNISFAGTFSVDGAVFRFIMNIYIFGDPHFPMLYPNIPILFHIDIS